MQCFIGIDPGVHGAVSWTGSDGPSFEPLFGMTERETWELLRSLSLNNACAMIETVTAMSPNKLSTFKLGGSFMQLRGFLVAAGIPFEEVQPKVWQRTFGLTKKYPTYTRRKQAHRAKAQELFPKLEITNDVADALLIAEHCCRCRCRDAG